MREGAWINAKTGDYQLVDHHTQWLRRNPDQALQLGLPAEVIAELGEIGWDLTPLAEKIIVLYKAMDTGFIRVRLDGAHAVFEFTIPWADAVHGARRFLREACGPSTACRFNSLSTNQAVEFLYGHVADRLGEADLSFLLPRWLRPRVPPPVRRPFLVAEVPGEGWICWPLPEDLDARALVDLIRGHVPDRGGWLAVDSRTWWVTPSTPPLVSVEGAEILRGYEKCRDCGWPRIGDIAPCKCYSGGVCQTCSLPVFWPMPGHEHVHLDGQVLHVPVFAAFGHRCVPWAHVPVRDLSDLLSRV